jgi:DNA-binding LacI/PurR family transcriptional regulator
MAARCPAPTAGAGIAPRGGDTDSTNASASSPATTPRNPAHASCTSSSATDTVLAAIIGGNDRCATGTLSSLVRDGVRLSQDLSIVGYDDTRGAGLPYLTTVRQGAKRMAALAAQAPPSASTTER